MIATAKQDPLNMSPLQPFGMLVYAEMAGMTLLDIPAAVITGWLDRYGLLVFRGYELLADEDYIAFGERFGPLLGWEFGKILELKIQPRPANHIFTSGRVELHWDGAFVENKPHYNVFQCLQGCEAGAGGQTLFVDTRTVLAAAGPELAAWRNISIEYAMEKKAHYGGTIRSPLVVMNPYSGREVIRYIEAFNEDSDELNPMQVRVENLSSERSDRFLREFTARLYRDDVMYRHTWRSGDFLIADNACLLHGRSRFNTAEAARHIKRINIL
jgi:L-tyrosine isonitrile desaturase/decarboxylase